jgi:hypothetical protein
MGDCASEPLLIRIGERPGSSLSCDVLNTLPFFDDRCFPFLCLGAFLQHRNFMFKSSVSFEIQNTNIYNTQKNIAFELHSPKQADALLCLIK